MNNFTVKGWALALSLIGLLEVWRALHPASLPFDWRGYWATARATPSQGIALWLMCFTTLLPTLVHLVWALTVWRTQKAQATIRAVALMRAMTDAPTEAQRIEIAALIQRGQLWGFATATLYWTPPLLAAAFCTALLIAS